MRCSILQRRCRRHQCQRSLCRRHQSRHHKDASGRSLQLYVNHFALPITSLVWILFHRVRHNLTLGSHFLAAINNTAATEGVLLELVRVFTNLYPFTHASLFYAIKFPEQLI